MDQVVDTETAQEFMKETLDKVDASTLQQLCAEVLVKSEWFQNTLSSEALPKLTEDDFAEVLRRIFATRGKTRQQLLAYPFEDMRSWMYELIHGDAEVSDRVDGFVDRLVGLDDNLRMDLAGELLHFTSPDRHWLWARWMWDPRTLDVGPAHENGCVAARHDRRVRLRRRDSWPDLHEGRTRSRIRPRGRRSRRRSARARSST